MLQFCGSVITSDGGLLAYRELDDVFALSTTGGQRLAEARTGKNRQHLGRAMLSQAQRARTRARANIVEFLPVWARSEHSGIPAAMRIGCVLARFASLMTPPQKAVRK